MLYEVITDLIRAANADIDEDNLGVGQRIKVPYDISVVPTDVSYTYDILQRNVAGLKARYPFIETGIASQSVLGRNIDYIRLGKGPNQVFYNGAHHALEWITTPLLMKFIEDLSKAYASGQNIAGYDACEIWEKSSIYIIPMVNPDGVDLVINGLSPLNPDYNQLISWNKGTDFSDKWRNNFV